MFGFAEDPPLGSERNSELQHCPSLVGSLTPKLHLRLVIAQSQEHLASKDFGPLQALAKIRGRQPERRSFFFPEAGARFYQSIPETGPRPPLPRPERARQTPVPFVASAAVEVGSAAELLS